MCVCVGGGGGGSSEPPESPLGPPLQILKLLEALTPSPHLLCFIRHIFVSTENLYFFVKRV